MLYNNEKINNKIISQKTTSPEDIYFSSNISIESYCHWNIDNSFDVFKSINGILYLIYSDINCSIIAYDLINNKKITEIKNAHQCKISNIRYYLDNILKRDLILSISGPSSCIKIWNIYNFELILKIEDIYSNSGISSACLLIDFKDYFILATASYSKKSIKKFDFNGNEIEEIKNSKERTYFIDIYYDIKFNKIYILTANEGNIKVYNYKNNEVKNIYCDNSNSFHKSLIVYENDLTKKIIESYEDGNIRIWDFNSGELLNKIKISKDKLFGICLWDNKYLFVGCSDKTIKLVNLNKNLIINSLKGHNNNVDTIKKIIHPQYGECLLSQGYESDKIILWTKF